MKKLLTSGYALIIFSSIALSFKAILVKVGYGLGMDAITLMLMRLYVAIPFFVAALLLMEGKSAFKVEASDMGIFALMGIGGMGLAMLFSFRSLELIDASVNMVLTFTYPAITVMIMAAFGGERVTASRIFSLAVTFAGLGLVVRLDEAGSAALSGASGKGALFALISAFCYALYNTIGQKVMKRISPVRVSAYCTVFLSVFYGGLFGMRPYPLDITVWGLAAVLGIFCGFLPFLALLYGIQSIGASRAAIISSSGPVFTAIWAYLFLGEQLDAVQLAGMGMVIMGVMALKIKVPTWVSFPIRVKEKFKKEIV